MRWDLVAASFLVVSAGAHADEMEDFIVNTVTPKSSEWSVTKSDPLGLGAFGIKKYDWRANAGNDRLVLFVDPEDKLTPTEKRSSDARAASRNCKDFNSKTDVGNEKTPYLGWSSECGLADGGVMHLSHFVYTTEKAGYKISRIWRGSQSSESTQEWQNTINKIVSKISN